MLGSTIQNAKGWAVDTIVSSGSITMMPSGDIDDYFTFATASNIPTIYGTGSYVRIGDAAATSNALASEDDLMVSGKLEVDGIGYFDSTVTFQSTLNVAYDIAASFVAGGIKGTSYDADARGLVIYTNTIATGRTPNVTLRTSANQDVDLGLFDGITQPVFAVIETAAQLHKATDGIADAGAASAILKHVGGFTNAVVGDIVRITAGTNCTAGWYWITTVTSADQVTLDRNYTSGDTTNVTFVTFHNFPMIGADGVCLKCFDGAPGDANTEIDRDGWIALDVGQANGRLYWRANNAYHYVDATAGLSLPKEERVDPVGHKFELGDTVKLVIDRINEDGSFHALPYFAG